MESELSRAVDALPAGRRPADDALSESARLILDNIPGIVLFMTPTGELEFANHLVTIYFGKTLDELKHWWTDDTVHPEDRAGARDAFARATASGQAYRFEARFRRHDGVYRWFECRGFPHRDETSRILRWYCTGMDIDKRKRAEALLGGEKQLLEMVASGRSVPEVLEALCRLVESTASGSYCSLVLVDASGTKLKEAIAPSLAPEFNEAVRGWPLDRRGGPCVVAARDKTPVIMSDVASDTRWRSSWRALAQKHGLRSCWSTPIVSQTGKVLGTFALYQREPGSPNQFQLERIRQFTNIASIAIERAQSDAVLRESEARRAAAERDLQLMIDTIPVFVAAYEPDGTPSFVNRTWQQYMGLTLEEATGPNAKKSSPHFHPVDAERIDQAWRASLASGEPFLTEARVRRADGQYRWHTSHRVPLRDENGKVVRWYSVGIDIEDRKAAEDALRQSEARLSRAERELQRTIDSIPAGVGTYNADGSRLSINKWVREFSGLSSVEDWSAAIHPDDIELVEERWRECIASGTPFELEFRVRAADGTYRWRLTRRVPVRDETGKVARWYGVGHDIEDRKVVEQALRDSERNSRLIVDSIPGQVAIFTPDGEFEFVNRQILEYFGTTLEDVTSKRLRTRETLHPEDLPRATELFKQSIASGEPFEFEVRGRRCDGVYRWFQSRGLPLRDTNGRIVRWLNLLIDIDERKRAEQQALEAERELQRLINNIPALVSTFSADGTRLYVNKRSFEVTGLSAEDLQGERWRKSSHPEEVAQIESEWRACLASGEPFEREVRTRTVDGTYRWHLTRRVPVHDEKDNVVRWYGVGLDIEDRKRAEEAQRESEARLVEAERDLQLALNTIPNLITAYAPDGSRIFANRSFLDYRGLTLEQALALGRGDIIHPEDFQRAEEEFNICQAAGTPSKAEFRLRRADGEYRWHAVHRVFARNDAGEIVRWYHSAVDIEEQKRAQEALRQSEAQLAETERDLRIMLDSIPTITWRAGANGYVQYLNKRWFEYTGTTYDQVRGWRWKLCVHPDDLDQLVNAGTEYVASGSPIDSEARLRRHDGEYRWFLFRPAAARDQSGNIVAWYGTITDIQDRKQAEQKAIEAERELQHMLNSIPAMIVRGATNGYIQYFSKQWFEYTGTTRETARGFRWWESLHPDDKDRLVEFGARFVATAEPADCEARLRRFDGTYRWFLFRPAAARDEAGNFIGWYGTVTDIEDRKRAEQKQLEAEREVQRTIDNIPVLVGTYAADGTRLSVNKRALEVTGLSTEDVPGERWRKAYHPDDVEPVESLWRACLANGTPFEREVRTRVADGTYRWHWTSRVPLRDDAGKVIRWYGIGYDIEDRKRAEEALAASESNLKRIIDTIPALVWSARLNGSAEFCNQSYVEYTGLPLEQLQNWGYSNAVHPADVDELGRTWRAIRASGRTGETEARLRRNDGQYRWFMFRATPLRDENGNPAKWFGIGYDIEDRKRAEQALRRSETFLAEGQRVSSTGTFSWRVDTDELKFSEELGRIFELDPNVVVTFEQVFARIHPEDTPALSERMKLVRSGRGPAEQEVRLLMPDGTIKYLRSVGQMIHHQDGRAEYLGAIQDVTQRRVAEAALDKVRSELTHVTRVMSLGALTASIAHEVNQPLAGIITNASTCLRMLAADPPNVDGARETARRTIRDGNRAADVIARLRALFGKKAAVTETLDLNEATREVLALVFSDLLRNRIIVRVELGDEPLLVTGDRVQLQQVILNLVRNASDAMSEIDDRPRHLLVRADREEDGARLIVKDTGVGLEPQAAEKLFDAFFSTKSEGMGIGLSVSRSIIESHGGKLWAEANDGPGATFSFSIPWQAANAGDVGIASALLTRPTRGAHDLTRNA